MYDHKEAICIITYGVPEFIHKYGKIYVMPTTV